MIAKLRSIPKKRYWDYFILAARFLLAFTFINYGYSKLVDGQFGVSSNDLLVPLKDLPLFKVMWFLFDHEPLKTTVGILQIITGILLLFESTAILGVIFFIPIAANIVLMDVSFMNEGMGQAFARRFAYYFILCFLILWNDKDRIKIIWNAITKKFSMKRKFPVFLYLLLPLFAIILEILPGIPYALYYYIANPERISESFKLIQSLFP
ncbi:hypothetical protein LPB90_05970 [Chryseobacterium sp. LC2016-29]|uniref:hypothetical protein n=1 Tax=Chryseobacterium sp. LC2016-29 TaxID=2897331 RepID=UPI001E31534B|nr:hypothetical protein [Chryseobacterium sp. LC2016-29]MCD0477994.1 hypothetical protein [Chryseobacterium sp. LC2016-29]